MALFELYIPAADPTGFNVTVRVRAESWMQALRAGLSKLGDTADVRNVIVDITEQGIEVTEPHSGRVFRICEKPDPAAALVAAVAPRASEGLSEAVARALQSQGPAAASQAGQVPPAPQAPAASEPPQSVPQPLPVAASQPIPEPVSQPLPAAASQPIPEPVSQPLPAAASQPIPEPVSQPLPAAASQPVPAPVVPAVPSSAAPTSQTAPSSSGVPLPAARSPAVKSSPPPPARVPPPAAPSAAALAAARPGLAPPSATPPGAPRFVAQVQEEAVAKERASDVPQAASPAIGRSKGQSVVNASADLISDLFAQTQALYEQNDLRSAAGYILDLAMKSVEADSGAVFIADINASDLYFAAARGPKAQEAMKFRVPMGQGIVGFCAQEGVSLAVSDVHRDPRFYAAVSKNIGYETRSILCVPAQVQGRVVGAIELINKRAGSSFTGGEISVLNFLAHEFADYMLNTEQTGA